MLMLAAVTARIAVLTSFSRLNGLFAMQTAPQTAGATDARSRSGGSTSLCDFDAHRLQFGPLFVAISYAGPILLACGVDSAVQGVPWAGVTGPQASVWLFVTFTPASQPR